MACRRPKELDAYGAFGTAHRPVPDTATNKPASAIGDIPDDASSGGDGEDWFSLPSEASAALALTEETLPEEELTEQCTLQRFVPVGDRWQSLREQANFSAVRACIEENAKIRPRQLLSQHFSKSCQLAEVRGQGAWSCLRDCGLDNKRKSAAGDYYVELELPYAYMPGDGFGFR